MGTIVDTSKKRKRIPAAAAAAIFCEKMEFKSQFSSRFKDTAGWNNHSLHNTKISDRENVADVGKRMLFTGPDGIRDHRVSVDRDHHYVGEGPIALEATSEVNYIWRSSHMSHPKPKSSCVGEVGWGIPEYADKNPPMSGQQITLGEFRQGVEDRHKQCLINAWYPVPGERTVDNHSVKNTSHKSDMTMADEDVQNKVSKSTVCSDAMYDE